MDTALESLYYYFVSRRCSQLRQAPEYQQAMQEWEANRWGSALEQEDALRLLEHSWGQIAFAQGLRLGLELWGTLAAYPTGSDGM